MKLTNGFNAELLIWVGGLCSNQFFIASDIDVNINRRMIDLLYEMFSLLTTSLWWTYYFLMNNVNWNMGGATRKKDLLEQIQFIFFKKAYTRSACLIYISLRVPLRIFRKKCWIFPQNFVLIWKSYRFRGCAGPRLTYW